jgi:hypothetical protein
MLWRSTPKQSGNHINTAAIRTASGTWSPCEKKTYTVGMFLGVWTCGLIAAKKEIFRHETTAQAASFLMGIIDHSQYWPKGNINH